MNERLANDVNQQRDLLALVEQALEQPAPRRDDWLAAACGGNEGLLARARRLLANTDETHAGSYANLAQGRDWSSLGLDINNYRVLRKLGSGGMAEVFEAERADGEFVSRVAVKVIKTECLNDQLLQQFAVERQTLANLKHPNIVSLLDGGTTKYNLPYVVMELIEGLPLSEFLATNTLTRSAKLELFDKICSAVEHAHASLIIHRDIKPGNIMVTAAGEPKLYDFGLAKTLGDSEREFTVAGAFTPAYASPEQVSGKPISVATDIYSLGAVLYFILTESPVHDVTDLSALATVTKICEGEIEKPSTRVTSKRLRGTISQDLDAITLKALAPEPERRYVSVSSLRSDLANLAARRPVAAQFDSRFYRIKKFVSRHRTGLVASAVSLAALMVGLGVSVQQTRLANQQLDRATIVSDLIGDILMSPASRWDVDLSAGPDAKMSDVLELAGQHIEANLTEHPDVQIELLSRLSIALERLSKNDQSLKLSETALKLVEKIESPELQIQALIAHGKSLTRSSVSEVGLQMLLRAERMLVEQGSGRTARYLYLLNDIGNAYGTLERFQDQIDTMNRALTLFADLPFNTNHPAAAGGYNNLASAQMNLGRFSEARESIDKAMAIVDIPKNQDEVVHAYVYMYSAVLELATNNLDRAARNNKIAIDGISELLGDKTKELSVALARQAIILRLSEQKEQALIRLHQALSVAESTGRRSRDLVTAQIMLANWQGDHSTAIAVKDVDKLVGSRYFFDVLSVFEIGLAQTALGDAKSGHALTTQAMDRMKTLYGGKLLHYMERRLEETSKISPQLI